MNRHVMKRAEAVSPRLASWIRRSGDSLGHNSKAAGRPRVFSHAVWTLFLLLGSAGSSGCNPADQVEQHVMPRERTGLPEPVRLPPAPQQAAEAVRSRMVTAIAKLPSATWFFKAVGPVQDMETALPQLMEFFKSVSFNEQGQPQYAAKAGWQEATARPGRFQTFVFGPDGKTTIELAISELGPNQDIPSNVNRWRRDQLGLSALDDTAANASLDSLPYQGGEFLLFDEIGMYRGGMSGPAMNAGAMNQSVPTAETPPPTASDNKAATPPLDFTVPTGWSQSPNPMFAAVRLEHNDGDKKVAISVSEMNPELNKWETALGSWLAELELPDLKAEQIEPFISEAAIDGQPGKQVKLLMPDAAKGIVAIRVERDGRAWFVKLSGERSLVESSLADLEAFLKSIKFKPTTDNQ